MVREKIDEGLIKSKLLLCLSTVPSVYKCAIESNHSLVERVGPQLIHFEEMCLEYLSSGEVVHLTQVGVGSHLGTPSSMT